LNCMIEIYISTKKAVSSLQISNELPFSSSTLRKELQTLESYGFIYKPFTSSGRIPTNKGLKNYLNGLKELIEIDDSEEDFLKDFEIEKQPDFNDTTGSLLSFLSENTQNIGFVFLNSIFSLNFKSIKLVKIGNYRVMINLVSPNNWSFSRVFETTKNYPEKDLKRWELTLNKEFKGNDLNTTLKKIRNRQARNKEKYQSMYKEMFFLFNNKDLVKSELLFKGELNVFESGFIEHKKIKGILQVLKEKEKLSSFLEDIMLNHDDEFSVIFGKDTGLAEFDDLILIASNFYHSENLIGNIGIIGPKFIHYKRTIKEVENYSAYLSRILSRNEMEV